MSVIKIEATVCDLCGDRDDQQNVVLRTVGDGHICDACAGVIERFMDGLWSDAQRSGYGQTTLGRSQVMQLIARQCAVEAGLTLTAPDSKPQQETLASQ